MKEMKQRRTVIPNSVYIDKSCTNCSECSSRCQARRRHISDPCSIREALS